MIKENGQEIRVDITAVFSSDASQKKWEHKDADGGVCIYAQECEENEKSHLYSLPLKEAGWYNIYGIGRDGGKGLAMMVYGKLFTWENAKEAPGMHYRIDVSEGGTYHVWLLMLYENGKSDSCYFALDGDIQSQSRQYNNGQLYQFATAHMYFWCLTCKMEISPGEHIFSIYACDTGLTMLKSNKERGRSLL